jgi:hypothetical protein
MQQLASIVIFQNVTNLLGVNRERALALAVGAKADFDLLCRILVEWAENSTAFSAVKFDVFKLREYTTSSSYNTGDSD